MLKNPKPELTFYMLDFSYKAMKHFIGQYEILTVSKGLNSHIISFMKNNAMYNVLSEDAIFETIEELKSEIQKAFTEFDKINQPEILAKREVLKQEIIKDLKYLFDTEPACTIRNMYLIIENESNSITPNIGNINRAKKIIRANFKKALELRNQINFIRSL